MDAPSLPRPHLFAHREALRLPALKVVEKLVEIVGRKLTAYIGGVKDARAVERWIAGGEIYGDAEIRLRFAYLVVRTLSEQDSPAFVQAWLTGVNPELGEKVPLRLMRENDIDAVAPAILSAARIYLSVKSPSNFSLNITDNILPIVSYNRGGETTYWLYILGPCKKCR